jgi:hypothetical protein
MRKVLKVNTKLVTRSMRNCVPESRAEPYSIVFDLSCRGKSGSAMRTIGVVLKSHLSATFGQAAGRVSTPQCQRCWSLIELKQELVYLWNYWALMMPCWWKIAKVVHEQWITFQLGCSKTHSSPYPLPASTAWLNLVSAK